jgi:hypothetical protein
MRTGAVWGCVSATPLLPCRGRWLAAQRRDGWGARHARPAKPKGDGGSGYGGFRFAERVAHAPRPIRHRLRRRHLPLQGRRRPAPPPIPFLPCRGRWLAAQRRDGWGARQARSAKPKGDGGSGYGGFRYAERAAPRRAPSVTGFAGDTFPYREGEGRPRRQSLSFPVGEGGSPRSGETDGARRQARSAKPKCDGGSGYGGFRYAERAAVAPRPIRHRLRRRHLPLQGRSRPAPPPIPFLPCRGRWIAAQRRDGWGAPAGAFGEAEMRRRARIRRLPLRGTRRFALSGDTTN